MAQSSMSGESSISKSFFWTMVALFGGMALLLAAGLFMASRVVHSLAFSSATDKKTVRTPLGDFRFQKANQVGPGLPVYPGAALVLPGADALPPPLKNDQQQVLTATYHSNDSRDFIINWYAERLGPEFVRHEPGDNPRPDVFREAQIGNADITFLGQRGDQVRIVALAQDSTGTKIILAHCNNREVHP